MRTGISCQGLVSLGLGLGGLGVASTQDTGAASGDKTDLLTRRSISRCGSWVTNVLMVTTTVRMFHGVHRHTSHTRPAVTLDFVFVERGSGLEHGLVNTSTAS